MRQPIQLEPKPRSRASALQITFPIALSFSFAILLTSAAVATPTLGNYPDTSLLLSTDTTVTPDADPTHTRRINVSTSTDFNGTLEGDSTTGVLRVTVGFAMATIHIIGDYPQSVAVGDFNGDGNQDLAVANIDSDNGSILLDDGAGHFSARANFNFGLYPSSVAVGDFNGDGKQNLAVGNGILYTVSILLGNGDGTFGGPPHQVRRWLWKP